jgi:hypothetical protein
MKQLKTQEVDMARDFTFGVRLNLEEAEEEEEDFMRPKHYVRPIEIDVLRVCSTVRIYERAIANSNSLSDP